MARKKKTYTMASENWTPVQAPQVDPVSQPIPIPLNPVSILPPSAAPRLTLLQIDEELYQLLNLLEEANAHQPPDLDSITAIKKQIDFYVTRGEAKVNAIAYTHSTCLMSADICKRHAAHYARMSKRWLSHAESIESSLHRTMLLTGAKEYKTAEHRLALVGVGGVEPLEAQLEIMKKEAPGFVRVLVEMSLATWETVKLFMEDQITAEVKSVEVDNAGTRAALQAGKTVTGARLLPRGERVKIE